MLLPVSATLPAADGWSRGDVTAVVGVIVAVVAIFVTIWTVRYIVKPHVYRDDSGVFAIIVKNRGRQPASVGPVRLVVRRSRIGRVLRSITRHESPVWIIEDGLPREAVDVGPNTNKTWYLLHKDNHRYLLPKRWHPFAKEEMRFPEDHEPIFEITRGSRRPSYVRRARKSKTGGQFATLPTSIVERLNSAPEPASPAATAAPKSTAETDAPPATPTEQTSTTQNEAASAPAKPPTT
jgi:hypothetical protein